MAETYYKGYLRKLADKATYSKGKIKRKSTIDSSYTIGCDLKDLYIAKKQGEEIEKEIEVKNKYIVKEIYQGMGLSYLNDEKVFDQEIYFTVIEVIEEKHTTYYAKEVFTGQIFPILLASNIDEKGKFNKLKLPKKVNSNIIKDCYKKSKFKIEISCDYIQNNIIELNNFFYWHNVKEVSKNEVYKYLDKVCKVKDSNGEYVKNQEYYDKIVELSNLNVFRKQIIKEEEKVEREKMDDITSHMERIKFLLLQLNKVNSNKAQKYKQKYEAILKNCNNDLTLNPLDINLLISLEAEIEFQKQFSNDNNDDGILKTLDNIINEYNLNKKTDKTIKDIDKLFELFLQMKSNYSPITKSNSIEKFALIYIYEIYENKDIINIEDLSNSYINDILLSIIMCLNNLIENGEIENNFILKLDENITCDYVIDCIKKINVTKQKVYKKD